MFTRLISIGNGNDNDNDNGNGNDNTSTLSSSSTTTATTTTATATTSSSTWNNKKITWMIVTVAAISLACISNIDMLAPTLDEEVSSIISSSDEIQVAALQNVSNKNENGDIDADADGDGDVEEDGDDGDDDDVEEDDGSRDKDENKDGDNHDHDHDSVACYKSPMLPKTMYSVIGHESSGTQFTTGIIKDALKLPVYREGSFPYPKQIAINPHHMEEVDIQAQHFSLPWGSVCTDPSLNGKQPPIVDVVMPSQCTRDHSSARKDVRDCCEAMAKDLNLPYDSSGNAIKYPSRYNLDIVSHKDWWDAHGVDQWMIIVLRDMDISATARFRGHCSSAKLLAQEQETARSIIIDAINKYILDKDEKKVTSETYDYWHAERFIKPRDDFLQRRRRRRNMLDADADADVEQPALDAPMIIPSRNKVVLVSYESMMHLREVYVEMLFQTLGIDTKFMPTFKNGNSKYVPNSPLRGYNHNN